MCVHNVRARCSRSLPLIIHQSRNGCLLLFPSSITHYPSLEVYSELKCSEHTSSTLASLTRHAGTASAAGQRRGYEDKPNPTSVCCEWYASRARRERTTARQSILERHILIVLAHPFFDSCAQKQAAPGFAMDKCCATSRSETPERARKQRRGDKCSLERLGRSTQERA